MSEVTVYTQPGCLSCKRVIEKLEDAGIEVEVIDVLEEGNEEALTYVKSVLKARSVPVIVSDVTDPIKGYEPTMLKYLIRKLRPEHVDGEEIRDYVHNDEEESTDDGE